MRCRDSFFRRKNKSPEYVYTRRDFSFRGERQQVRRNCERAPRFLDSSPRAENVLPTICCGDVHFLFAFFCYFLACVSSATVVVGCVRVIGILTHVKV